MTASNICEPRSVSTCFWIALRVERFFKPRDWSVVTRRRATLKRDAPGVGVPVVDQLRQAGLVTAEMQRCGWLETQRYQTGESRSVNLEGRATAIRLR